MTVYCRNPSLEIVPFYGYSPEPHYQAIINNRHLELNDSTFRAVALFDRPRTLQDAACLLEGEPESTINALRSILANNQLIVPVGEITSVAKADVTSIRRTNNVPFLLFRRKLLTANQICGLTTRLSMLYTGRALMIGAFFIIASHFLLFGMFGYHTPSFVKGLTPGARWAGIGLVYASLILHELGHAAACRRHGIMHGEIGIAIYGFVPILYADVTNAWRLTRRDRVIVDVAGMYLQEIVASLCIVLWVCTHWSPFLFCTYCVLIATLINLNPFFRFDGYWILADSLGVPRPRNLGQEMLKQCALRVLRSNASSTWRYAGAEYVKYVLMLYAVGGLLLTFLGSYVLVTSVLPHLVALDRATYMQITRLTLARLRWSALLATGERCLLAATSSIAMGMFLFRLVCRCGSAVRAYLL